ncbi:MAG: rhomboid family intramembrane serine protease [Elusimicrobia bacterium]|nr:rhomboid family intramembrane serine protease [Elusimicrobiota bacterium]
MIPLYDTIPSRSFPAVTVALIAVNVAAFGFEASLGRHAQAFILDYGLVPLRFVQPGRHGLHAAPAWLTPWTSMFLHGGLMHLLSNMWMLWIFGDNVEDRMGRVRFLSFYLLAGFAAAMAQLAAGWGSPVPVIGASGAIAGVMGAYFLLFPHARVVTLVPVFVFLQRVELPAFVFLAVWFLTQVHLGASGSGHGGIAWWAHIGGFVAGLALGWRFSRGRRA